MPRPLRALPGGFVFHVMNRASMGIELFSREGDYLAFEKAMAQGRERWPGLRVLSYCLMPNHFHMVVWPRADGEVSAFLKWVSMTFAARWHAQRQSVGRGRVFQGRFKSFPIQRDEHVSWVCRYVERNPLRAGLVQKAELWRWGSLGCRVEAGSTGDRERANALMEWNWDAVPEGRGSEAAWLRRVNAAETPAELVALRKSVTRGSPFGNTRWTSTTADKLGLRSSMRSPGRPKGKASAE